jgi:hypothetical protein
MKNPKAEGRRPKEGRNPKTEKPLICRERTQRAQREVKNWLFRCALCVPLRQLLSDFGIRPSFGLRPSAFGFSQNPLPIGHSES